MARTAPVPNIPAIPGMNPGVFIMGGGTIMMLTTLRKLYWGVGKIELKD